MRDRSSVEIAKTAGFCFGVERAIESAYKEAENRKGPIYTLGPLIHNEHVVEDLRLHGVEVLSEDDLSGTFPEDAVVIIRSHGVSRALSEKLRSTGMRIVDATCPFVKKIHTIVEEESARGRHILIFGDPDHPEVIGICGWVNGDFTVVRNEEELQAFSRSVKAPVTLVSQTTFREAKFQELVEIAKQFVYDINILDTICHATRERQEEAMELAARADIMLVVGSRKSSNTQKLYDICKAKCGNTYYIQTLDDLVPIHFHSEHLVGITAGASTPNKIIAEVSQYVRRT